MTTTSSLTASRRQVASGRWYRALAAWAWLGLLVQLSVTASGVYPSDVTTPSLYGFDNPGATGRIVDFFSYFTIWSNIAVAAVATVLARQPNRDTQWLRAFRLSSLLMISITGLVYGVLLAGLSHLQGWQVVANFFVHQSTPLLAVVVFVVAGPRGWIDGPTVARSMVLPLVWLAYCLLRGAAIGSYPYFFLDVVRLGYGRALLDVTGVLLLGLVVALVLLLVDRGLSRRSAAVVG